MNAAAKTPMPTAAEPGTASAGLTSGDPLSARPASSEARGRSSGIQAVSGQGEQLEGHAQAGDRQERHTDAACPNLGQEDPGSDQQRHSPREGPGDGVPGQPGGRTCHPSDDQQERELREDIPGFEGRRVDTEYVEPRGSGFSVYALHRLLLPRRSGAAFAVLLILPGGYLGHKGPAAAAQAALRTLAFGAPGSLVGTDVHGVRPRKGASRVLPLDLDVPVPLRVPDYGDGSAPGGAVR